MNKRLPAVAVLLWLTASAAALAAEVNGELEWADSVSLSVPIDGVVTEVNARPGTLVEADSELVLLDARIAQAHVVQARSTVRKLELLRAEAQREFERAQELYDRTVLSEHELQVAEIGAANAEADFHAAQSAQVSSEVALELHTVKAPFAARVLAVHVAPGQAVLGTQQVQPLVTLAARERLRVRARVEPAQAAQLAPDSSATVKVGDQQFTARIIAIGAGGDAGGEQQIVEAEFDLPPDSTLHAGQPATLVLP